MSRDNDKAEGTIAKRQKLANGSARATQRTPRIFAPFRTVGLVAPTPVPFTSLPLGKTTFQITTSVGKCLHTYDLAKGLNLVFLTRPQTPGNITATVAWKDRIVAAWDGRGTESRVEAWVFKRGKRVGELEMPIDMTEPITKMIVFGSWIAGCCSNRIEVWKSTTYEHYTTLTPTAAKKESSSSTLSGGVCNMPTYLNKIFVGKCDGSLDIWNLSTGKLIHTILPPSAESDSITALEASPALSVIAIARADGSIVLHDVRKDMVILELNAKVSNNPITTSISFRSDGLGAGEDGTETGIMATAGPSSGDVTFWDLNNGGRISGILRGAHNPPAASGSSGGISKVEFLPGQDVIITSGIDNALKSWIFDSKSLSSIPRILHSRCGHAAHVTRLSFVPTNSDGADASGKWLMSAGKDQTLWGWSLRRDGQSTELSQGNVRKKAKKLGLLGKSLETERSTTLEDLKAPEVTCMACSLNRDGGMGASAGGGAVWTNTTSKKGPADASESNATGWESVVTGHRGDKYARTWFWGRKKAGRWAFESGDSTEVTSVAVTVCGTFALVGSAGGSISMFNLQSGILRQKFPSTLTPAQARRIKMSHAAGTSNGMKTFALGEGKHKKAITGLMVDGLNRTLISCGLDGKINFWDFLTGCLQQEVDWAPMTAIISSQYHRPSDLIALSCDDLSIRIVDTETKKLVRELWGCLGQISDFCFSNDGRWIIAASMDSVIRVWDLPTGHLINALKTESPCTALAFSDTGEYLATAHADTVGINIWNNRTLFTHVPTRLIQDDEITTAIIPTTSGEGGQGLINTAFEEDDANEDEPHDTVQSLDQLNTSMLTLSLVPKSRWQTLLHLDTIRARNKPKEPPKPPEKAPFFLPSLDKSNLNNSAALPPPSSEEQQQTALINKAERSRISKSTPQASTFTTLLHNTVQSGNYDPFLIHLSTLGPSAADLEIRSLTAQELPLFVSALTYRLRQKRDYELVQAWMSVFLRLWGESIVGGDDDDGGGGREWNGELRERLKEWRSEQEREGKRLGELVGFCGGVLGFLRSGR
ncbi:rRNA-processing protein utp21 [Lecanora helva]